jgi:hypothetical protein
MKRTAVLYFCVGLVCLVAAQWNRGPDFQALSTQGMTSLVGGGCDQSCQNACQTSRDCSTTCSNTQAQGTTCRGGGGGTGTAWRCVYLNSDGNTFCNPPAGNIVNCTPTTICQCTGGSPNNCQSNANTAAQDGYSISCSNTVCKS